jgi:hypothetical protein
VLRQNLVRRQAWLDHHLHVRLQLLLRMRLCSSVRSQLLRSHEGTAAQAT